MKRFLTLVLAAAMTLSLLAGCGGNNGGNNSGQNSNSTDGSQSDAPDGIKTGGTIIIGQSAEPITLNPNGKTDNSMTIVAQNVFSRLLKTNNNEEIILDLATGYTVSEDGKALSSRKRLFT